ncbi:4a-hydroxytetrahydrobiopterin dehydratase [Brachybacterium sp. DNPG3]
MDDDTRILDAAQASAAAPAGFRASTPVLTARYRTGDFATGLALVERIGAAAEEAGHHPDVLLTYPSVTVTLTSHDVGGITSRDLDLAATIASLAAQAGIAPDADDDA